MEEGDGGGRWRREREEEHGGRRKRETEDGDGGGRWRRTTEEVQVLMRAESSEKQVLRLTEIPGSTGGVIIHPGPRACFHPPRRVEREEGRERGPDLVDAAPARLHHDAAKRREKRSRRGSGMWAEEGDAVWVSTHRLSDAD